MNKKTIAAELAALRAEVSALRAELAATRTTWFMPAPAYPTTPNLPYMPTITCSGGVTVDADHLYAINGGA